MRTFSIIKPDAVAAGKTDAILRKLRRAGFRVVKRRKVFLNKARAEGFYAVHRERPFFSSLTDFMSSGPAVVIALERDDAISELRRLMGATNPAEAAPGTIRAEFATSIERNAIHGSDAPESAEFELRYFFPNL